MIRVVVLAPAGGPVREALPGGGVVQDVVTFATGAGGIAVPRPGMLLQRLDAWALRTPIGRAVRRLTWLDPGVVFWRATRRSAAARQALSDADVIVAVERDALFAAYMWARARRQDAVDVVDGYAAARVRIAARMSAR